MSDTGTSPQSADLCEQSGEHVDRLWESLRTQAGEIAAAEPTLSSLLAEVVLDQPCLGSALGVRLARKLARIAAQKITERPRYVGVLHMPGGHTFYGPSYVSPEGEEGTIRGFTSELWEDDGSKEFEEVYERTRREGKFLAS